MTDLERIIMDGNRIMGKYGMFFCAVAAMSVAACTVETEVIKTDPETVKMEFTAVSDLTRTALTDGNAVVWQSGDMISVFDPKGGNNLFITEDSGPSARFTGEAVWSDGDYYALYPYNKNAGIDVLPAQGAAVSIRSSLVSEQPAVNGSFGTGINPSIAKANGTDLHFRNLCALVKFTLNIPDGVSINRVILKGNNSESLAGDFRASIVSGETPSVQISAEGNTAKEAVLYGDFSTGGTYYFTVFPAILTNGFEIRVYDSTNRVWTKKGDKQATLVAGRILNLGDLAPEFTENSPIAISTPDDLAQWAASGNLDSDVILEQDIDMTGKEWLPVGTLENGYCGKFDGNGKKISHLKVTGDVANAGLFGGVGRTGSVTNLTVESADIAAAGTQSSAGVIAGFNMGRIEDCKVISSKVLGWYAGAVAGNNSVQVTGCEVSDVTVNASSDGGRAGGVAGVNYGKIEGCTVSGTCSILADVGNGAAGGITGMNSEESGIVTGGRIYHCSVSSSAVSDFSISGMWAGGIVGENNFGTVAQCHSDKVTVIHSSTSQSARLGGIAGFNTRGDVVACYSALTVLGKDGITSEAMGGIVGYNSNSSANVYGCYSYDVSFYGNISGSESGKGTVAGYTNGKVISCCAHAISQNVISLVGRSGSEFSLQNCVETNGTGFSVLTAGTPDLTVDDGTVWKADGIWSFSNPAFPAIIDNYNGENGLE